MTQYRDALRLAPDNPTIRYNMAILYNKKGQTREAVGELERAIELDPTLVAAFVQLGTIYRRIGNPTLAREVFLKALSLDPKNRIASEQLAAVE